MRMASDAVLWGAVMTAVWVVVLAVSAWLWSTSPENPPPTKTSRQKPGVATAPARPGWAALAVSVVLAAFVVWSTIARSPVASTDRGQALAAVAGGLFFGAAAARYFTGVEDLRWYAPAPLLLALTGYLLGYLNADLQWALSDPYYLPYADLATTPPHSLSRPLPVEYLAVGTAGLLMGFRFGRRVETVAEEGRL
jgi:hypothetical protein